MKTLNQTEIEIINGGCTVPVVAVGPFGHLNTTWLPCGGIKLLPVQRERDPNRYNVRYRTYRD